MEAGVDEAIEEVGESSSPPRGLSHAGGEGIAPCDIKDEIFARLMENGIEEVVSNPHYKDELIAHFNRLPASYLVDVSIDKAEDVLLHQKILAEAENPERRPAFHVRFMKLEDLNLDVRKTTEDTEDGTNVADALPTRHDVTYVPIHEVTFSTIDKPKLLSQLSALLSDIGLNIREAHVFSTMDGYSLDVFVVDGWHEEDTDGLHKELEAAIARNEGSWSGSSHSSAAEKILAVQPKVGEWEIDKRLLKMEEKIASGSCGDLYRGSYLGEDVAIKVLRSEHLHETAGAEFAQEVMILREVQHRNVVRFIGACTKPPQLCIVTEYLSGGNLYDFLHKHHNILELPVLLKFALDICRGMDYLHQNNIVHRDLKTANLLMDNNHVVKVADFGVARFQNRGGDMTAETGTYRWMAPEVINHQPYDHKADIFSFAIVLWELATSKIPYDTMTPLQAALGVRQGMRPELPEHAHPGLLDLMQRCWGTAPAKRPSFSQIIVELEELLKQLATRPSLWYTGLPILCHYNRKMGKRASRKQMLQRNWRK
ncbi:serine/threonine-protein kinase STY46 isoform X2 [Elaeis guineensis]|uniref:non-specific serine/threonine protein kinase n=1 Tax=Elaeis guineensis var. tenera TaxID=51953 RepID=A0A6J0PMR4_ELAGV|nr:serine/threonine-protein kinase STY46 isoform X1 [Elaeis guineensis]